MKIGIEAERANTANPTGVEHYAQQIILHLAKLDQKNTYVLYLRNQPSEWMQQLPQNFQLKVIPFPLFWTQLRISWEMLFHPVDALFIMASALPLIHPKNSVVTIHDIAWEFYPETFGKFMLNYLRFSTWYAVKNARKVIAVSEQTKKDLIAKYAIPADKVVSIWHGFDISSEFADVSSAKLEEEKQKIAELPEKFLLYISTLQPRKNVLGLIDAFLELKKEKNIPHSLVLVGGRGWLDTYIKVLEISNKYPEVIYAGYAYDRFAYIQKAEILVLPSFYEGFGMTILDAFAMNVPMATSNVSSMPEVAGEAAEYFDPHDKESIKKALWNLIENPQLREDLAAKGRQRLQLFKWEDSAKKHLQVITE